MRLPDRLLGVEAERVLRVTVFAVLLWALWQSVQDDRKSPVQTADSTSLRRALVRWSTTVAPERVHARLETLPTSTELDWLAAISRAGTSVTWGTNTLVPTSVVTEPMADPKGGVYARVAVSKPGIVVISDLVGPLDSATSPSVGIQFVVPSFPLSVTASVRGQAAYSPVRDSLLLRRLLVLGAATWESKFVVAALEEQGWKVDAEFRLSPKTDVTQGSIGSIDTADYAAVIVMDPSAARYANRIIPYVRRGGGLLLTDRTAITPAFAMVAAGRSGPLRVENELRSADTAPLRTLALAPIVNLKEDAVALQYRDKLPTVVARRVGLGRVVQIGYRDVWRWRMGGGDGALAAHREWWATLVAGVAYRSAKGRAVASANESPYASIVERIGPPSPMLAADGGNERLPFATLAFTVFAIASIVEWASRRLRGSK
jgi:hypothetical protein